MLRNSKWAWAWLPWSIVAMQPGDFQRLIDAKVIDFKMGEKGCKEERVYRAIVAGTPLSQELGFGQRTTPLSADESMFFVYDVPKFTQFWMKNTLIPLSIGFFDQQGKLLSAFEMPVEVNPEAPIHRYSPHSPFSVAIEAAPRVMTNVPAGKATLCVNVPVQLAGVTQGQPFP